VRIDMSTFVLPHPDTLAAAPECPAAVPMPKKLKVTVTPVSGGHGIACVAVPGFGGTTAASVRKADVRAAIERLVGPQLVQARELRCYSADDDDDGNVVVRYRKAGRFQPTGPLKCTTLCLVEPELCFFCGLEFPIRNGKRRFISTPSGFMPRRSACSDVHDACPRSLVVGNARFKKDTHNHRLIVTLASSPVVDAVACTAP
jgi:hypothetical protein